MKLINYESRFTIKDYVPSLAAASHLWHLSHIFKTFDFFINGVTKNLLADKNSLRSVLKRADENLFLITIYDHDDGRVFKHMEFITFILADRYPNIHIEFKLLEEMVQ